jgi:amyloid beta precursor protein binding protein 1
MVVEAVRCAGGEPHTVAAVLGGVGAQEVIKLVTGQFEPEAHTLVYDAAKAVTAAVL